MSALVRLDQGEKVTNLVIYRLHIEGHKASIHGKLATHTNKRKAIKAARKMVADEVATAVAVEKITRETIGAYS